MPMFEMSICEMLYAAEGLDRLRFKEAKSLAERLREAADAAKRKDVTMIYPISSIAKSAPRAERETPLKYHSEV